MVGPQCHFCDSEKHQQGTIPAAFPCWDEPTPAPRTCCQALIYSSCSSFSPSPLYLPFSIFATVTRPLHPSLAGISHVWLLLPDVFIPPFQPLIMYMSYEQRAQGILEAMGKSSPPPAPRIFQCILRDKSFLLAISSEKLVYPPFPPYIINETTLMNIS